MKPWTSDYLSIPYLDGGRSREGADCFGLYALILAEKVGKVLPNYEESWGKDTGQVLRRIEEQIASGEWIKVEGDPTKVARAYDCVQMMALAKGRDGVVRRAEVHLGCALGNGKVLHVEDKRGPRIVRMDDESIRRKIAGVYRLKVLCNQS